MGSDDDQSNEMALNSTKAATDQGQGGLEEENCYNPTTQLTVDLVKDNPSDDPMELVEIVWHALIPPKSRHKQPIGDRFWRTSDCLSSSKTIDDVVAHQAIIANQPCQHATHQVITHRHRP
ncbi:unnamed protein product [Cylindrotheca closterium]|uniref:Uncharacterized protein n=1 Tax=Cylindrotheca closterium TaxID=2856 RepID=A0AAD2G4Y5_9STRA|nr:unnamed protein product [Cylindrotheca closterium]